MRIAPLVLIAALAACDDGTPTPDGDIKLRLEALPMVASVTESPTDLPGYRYFELQIQQPVDHDDPDGGWFLQYATLIHRDLDAPLVMFTTGYGNWYYDHPSELTRLLHGNQIAIEHRFFRGSRPTDLAAWSDLTIEQAAADHHVIATALHDLYGGAFLATGASKGGMTSLYHRRFYPDDVDATVAFVAPLSIAAPDYRYDGFLDAIGPAPCRDALHAVQIELLTNRRPMLQLRAAEQPGRAYTRVAVAAAVESAVIGLEWSFWQTKGVASCSGIPSPTGSDDALWAFVKDVSPVDGASDAEVADFEAYYHQAEHELGYPGTMDDHLTGLVTFPSSAYDGVYPTGVPRPAYSPAPMQDIDGWLRGEGERILLVYGEYDPWTGGMFELGGATDSLRVLAPMGSHYSGIVSLAPGDRDAALAKLEAWSGVTPDVSVWDQARLAAAPPRVRTPPMMRRR